MDELWTRVVENMLLRLDGPLHARLLLQPLVASVLAVMAGLRDARAGKPPYFWALATDPAHRREMVRSGWKDVSKVFLLAIVLDIAYQFVVSRFVYPGEVLLVALLLAIVPYLVLRGLTTRLARVRGPA